MSKQEQTMHRYLLGELPEAERAALEQEYFSDRQLFEQVVRAENELLDEYARGLLPPETRERFEHYYLAHPKRRERAKFAAALAAKVDRVGKVAVATSARIEPWWDRMLASMRAPKLAWALSVVVLLIMAGAAGWFLIETRRLRQEFARIRAERATQEQRERELQQQASNERLRSEELSAELDRLRVEQAEQQVVATSPTPQVSAAPAFVTLALTVGGTRGPDTVPPALLVIPARTEQVRLQLRLRDHDYAIYRAVLQSPGGGEVYAWQRLSPKTSRAGARLTLIVPARRLAAGDYILTLRGVSKTGEVEDVSKSLFRVDRR